MNNKKIFWWIIAIGWCLLIAYATRTPFFTGDSTKELLTNPFIDNAFLNFILRKAGHMVAFGLLALFCFLALKGNTYRYILAWMLATIYGAVDEWHQSFIPARDGQFTDVLINSTGALLTLVVIFVIKSYTKKR
ncbi:VanZ family protein [Bacillus alkalicellulosilyticus]|uniref:VanZ family protein n=1 Tax=Alkalihalobacterium alkalicellulosilyticum TaxID=1912214 RepID=UPI00148361E4|nr:VanZ family protein [Bacillus alkalicellulosilyticus]